MPFTVTTFPISTPTKSHNQPMTDFALKNYGPAMTMPFSFTKTPSSKGSYPEATQFWHYEIFDNNAPLAVMQASTHFLHANISAAGKKYQISPVINYFTLNKYLVLENDLDVGEIVIPGLLHKKLSIEIYGEGVWQIKRSQARYKAAASNAGFYELEPPIENTHPSPLLSALFLFLSEVLAWEYSRI